MSLLFADRPDDIARLRDALNSAGFTTDGVAEVLGPHASTFLARDELAPLLWRTRGASVLETLIRLFVCGVAVDRTAAGRALAPLPLEAWNDAEMIGVRGDEVVPRIKLRPIAGPDGDWLVPHDAAARDAQEPDHVLGVGPASTTLAGVTIRRAARRCLDLGTGSGIQALHAQRHSERVVATDRNPRAAAFAAFTMRVNDVDNVEVREGDLFEPVAAERFDLIVSNPPFVISPRGRFVYRDSGLVGDEVCRRIVTGAAEHLEPDGWCQLLANWAHVRGQDWQQRLAEWVGGIGCDAWIVQSRVEDAETYATTWIGQDHLDRTTRARLFDEWMQHYDEIGLDAVGFGLITLRRTTAAQPWVCLEELARDFALPCGEDIATAFDRARWLADHGVEDRALLATRLVIDFDVVLRETSYGAEGQWHVDESLVELRHGLRYATVVDSLGADLIAGCDGATPVAELLERLASAVGVTTADIAPTALATLRRFIQQGYVRAVEP